MKATELRIGNWLQRLDGSLFQVDEHTFKMLVHDIPEHLHPNPVPLTEEWLIDLGAKGRISPLWISLTNLKSELHFECHESGEIVTMLKGDFADLILDRLKYVHELQNLYFALTGTELTIKQ